MENLNLILSRRTISLFLAILTFLSTFSFVALADANGVNHEAADVKAGTFASDEGNGNFIFPNKLGINTTPTAALEIKSNSGENPLSIFSNVAASLLNLTNAGDLHLIAGKLGIGTAAPGSKLHVASENTENTPQGDIIMSRLWTSPTVTRASAIFHYLSRPGGVGPGSDFMAFGVSGQWNDVEQSYLAPNDLARIKMVIGANGNVGIGTISPSQKLVVVGDVNITGNITIGSGTTFINGSHVGIGTSSPLRTLDVNGTFRIVPLVPTFSATGGNTIVNISGYTYHKFTSFGTFTPASSGTIEVLVVAGGGPGGFNRGGGGGAGGVVYDSEHAVTAQAYNVAVGGSDQNSVFDNIIALAGGSGGGPNAVGSTGGSGGGGGHNIGPGPNSGGSATQDNSGGDIGYGSAGGTGGTGTAANSAGGGGGANGAGANAGSSGADTGGNGGAGICLSQFTAASLSAGSPFGCFAGGGGGGGFGASGGTGGTGGGGDGATVSVAASTAGIANTGGGGGGGTSDSQAGASGGSGIVIIRYPIPGNPIGGFDFPSTGNAIIGTTLSTTTIPALVGSGKVVICVEATGKLVRGSTSSSC